MLGGPKAYIPADPSDVLGHKRDSTGGARVPAPSGAHGRRLRGTGARASLGRLSTPLDLDWSLPQVACRYLCRSSRVAQVWPNPRRPRTAHSRIAVEGHDTEAQRPWLSTTPAPG